MQFLSTWVATHTLSTVLSADHQANKPSFSGWLNKVVPAFLAMGILAGSLPAADIIKVEEDWELVITDPDVNNYSPQINLFLSPNGSSLEQYFQLQLNHAAQDDFTGGGFRVAAILGESNYDQARGNTLGALSNNKDCVRWTNVVAIQNGEYLFAVKNGFCQSWGMFGGPEYLVRMPAGENATLDTYDPQTSVDLIDIGFGKNRVTSLRLLRVRRYDIHGQIVTTDINQGF